MRAAVLAVALLALVGTACAAQWAFIIAGSNGFYNYRHQADSYAAYQIFRANGIPASNIILMHYNDIANSDQNPFKGKVFNWDNNGTLGPDVFANVPTTCTGSVVTVDNVLKILTGVDVKGCGSIKSTENDFVTVAFFDHGTTNAVAILDDLLSATQLVTAVKKMKYKKLVFYIEACESGSMGLPFQKDFPNVYMVTAANPTTSSYACDYNSKVATYLNDCFAYQWTNDVRAHQSALNSYTFQSDYNAVQPLVTQSNVCQYGDLSVASDAMGLFIGSTKATGFGKSARKVVPEDRDPVEMHLSRRRTIEKRLETAVGAAREELIAEYNADLKEQNVVKARFAAIAEKFNVKKTVRSDDPSCFQSVGDADCIESAQRAYIKSCKTLSDHALNAFKLFSDICMTPTNKASLVDTVNKVCA
eukprot:ANDGO_08547.mRNA.1 Hemoglobinase